MSDLTDFLLARIAEDEAVAKVWRDNDAVVAMQADFDPDVYEREPWARVLAGCEARRRIVEEWVAGANRRDEQGRPVHLFDPSASMLLKSHAGWLRILAAVYADHPDYREEWRP